MANSKQPPTPQQDCTCGKCGSEKKKFKCEVCKQTYSTIEGLTLHNHFSWKHNPEVKPTLRDEIEQFLKTNIDPNYSHLDCSMDCSNRWYEEQDRKEIAEELEAIVVQAEAKTRQRVIDEVMGLVEETIENEAKKRCFEKRTAHIFWDGWGAGEKEKWVKVVKKDDFASDLLSALQGIQTAIDKLQEKK